MTTARCQPFDHAVSPSLPVGFGDRLEHLREMSGLTWRELASRLGVSDRGPILRRRGERPRSGPGHRAIVALARDWPGGYDRITGGDGG